MSRRKSDSEFNPEDRISKFMDSLKFKDLQRACILRGMPFERIARYDFHKLQSWLFVHFDDRQNPMLLAEYDFWRDRELLDQGYIESPIPNELRLAFFGEDGEGKTIQRRRNIALMGPTKSDIEIANFKPRRGSKKSLVFQLIREGKPTKEIIEEVMDTYPDASEGSIKNWCSQARRSVKMEMKLKEKENGKLNAPTD